MMNVKKTSIALLSSIVLLGCDVPNSTKTDGALKDATTTSVDLTPLKGRLSRRGNHELP